MATPTSTTTGVITADGIAVTLVPLPTPWPQGPACATNMHKQADGRLIMYDFVYGVLFDQSQETCFPDAVSTWTQRDASQTPQIALGGKIFACPALYTTASESVVDSTARYIYCCPSPFTFNTPLPINSGFGEQCFSTASTGQVLEFLNVFFPDGSDQLSVTPTSSTVDSAATIFGGAINGFIVQAEGDQAASGNESVASTIDGGGDGNTGDGNTGDGNTGDGSSSGGGGLSAGASAGIGVGVTLAVIGIAIAAFFLWRRRRRSGLENGTMDRGHSAAEDPHVYALKKAPVEVGDGRPLVELGTEGPRHELQA